MRILFLLFFTGALFLSASAQNNDDYALGNRLLDQGEYEEAYDIFRELMQSNPGSYSVYDRAVEALIALQRYEEAVEISQERLDRRSDDINTHIKLGEIYLYADQKQDALDTWDQLFSEQPGNTQVYRRIAQILRDRRMYAEAIDVYQRSREELGQPRLFTREIANNNLAIGHFEEAMDEYLDLLAQNEQEMSRIQRELINYDERRLYDTAIMLTGDRIDEQTDGSETDMVYRDFLIWLTMERGLYRRALTSAQTMEELSGNERHILFRIGRQLRSQDQFELAEEAFTYYLDLEHHPLQARSHEELSRTYQNQATYLIDQNRDFGGAAHALYRKAFDVIERLTNRYPRYERIIETLMIQSELALDHLKEPELAETYLEKMESAAQSEGDLARAAYVEGRILLFQGDFTLARVALTRSNRNAESSELAEKSRYYLGLADFYNGDFTYARLQLRALERENHSFFANNALQLRVMIQRAAEDRPDTDPEAFDPDAPDLDTPEPDMLNPDAPDSDTPDSDAPEPDMIDPDAPDSDTPDSDALDAEEDAFNADLKRYARARYLYDTGKYSDAALLLVPLLSEPATAPLHQEQALLLTRALRQIHPDMAYRVIDRHTSRPSVTRNPGERLLWERARLSELLYDIAERQGEDAIYLNAAVIPEELLNALFEEGTSFLSTQPGETPDLDRVVAHYEELLMHYPEGYYAEITRNRIRELEQPSFEI